MERKKRELALDCVESEILSFIEDGLSINEIVEKLSIETNKFQVRRFLINKGLNINKKRRKTLLLRDNIIKIIENQEFEADFVEQAIILHQKNYHEKK